MRDRMALLADMNQRLLEAPRLEHALDLVAETALMLLPGDHASVRLCDADGSLRSAARAGVGLAEPVPSFRRGEGVLGWVAETGLIARVTDCGAEPRFHQRFDRGFPVGSLLSVPLIQGGRVLGVLSVSAATPAAFAEHDESVAQLLSTSAAQAVRGAELTQLAMTDPQTLCYNRRCLLPRLREEMERALRHAEPLCILLIDLDRFKSVNDRHGHAAGDFVLATCAERIRQCVRLSDVLVRRGGEEFVLIMPSADEPRGQGVAERVRAWLGDQPLMMPGGVTLTQTASIGVACWDGQESAEALEERADRAMYAAKRGGRNRVVVASPTTKPRQYRGLGIIPG